MGIHSDIKDMKSDMRNNNAKIDDLNMKMGQLESKSKVNEEENLRNFEAVRKDMAQLEETATSKVIMQLDPKISDLQNVIQSNVCTDLRCTVKEEMVLQKFQAEKE